MSDSQEIQVRTRCPKCEPRLASEQRPAYSRWLSCTYCEKGWVYAWVDPSSLYLAENGSVQFVADSAVRKALDKPTRCGCGDIATQQVKWPNGKVSHCCDSCHGRISELVNLGALNNISGGGIDAQRN